MAQRAADGDDRRVDEVLRARHRAEREDESRRVTTARERDHVAERAPQYFGGGEGREGDDRGVEEERTRLARETQRGEEAVERGDDDRRLAAEEQQREEDERVGDGDVRADARNRDAEARADEKREQRERDEAPVEVGDGEGSEREGVGRRAD